MNPKEKLPIVSNNMNSISFRPQSANPVSASDKESISSREAGNEIKRAVESFEQKLAEEETFQ